MMSNIFRFLKLLWLNLQIGFYQFWEFLKVIANYYTRFSFFKVDTYLLWLYAFDNAFKVSKRFLKQKGERDIYTFGETPLTTLDSIFQRIKLTKKDVICELGCGRGRSCFWLNQFIGCRVIGVDYVPEFVERANQVKKRFNVEGVEFRLEDFRQTDFKGVTIIYLYGTCLPNHIIVKLSEKFRKLPRGTKIITVSYSLTDYNVANYFEVEKVFSMPFTWGEGDVYVQKVR